MKSYIFQITLIFIFLSILVTSCQKDKIFGDVKQDPNLIKELYAKSKDTLLIENYIYKIIAELSRDFFPTIPSKKTHPLIAYITLINLDSVALPSNIDMVKLSVDKSFTKRFDI